LLGLLGLLGLLWLLDGRRSHLLRRDGGPATGPSLGVWWVEPVGFGVGHRCRVARARTVAVILVLRSYHAKRAGHAQHRVHCVMGLRHAGGKHRLFDEPIRAVSAGAHCAYRIDRTHLADSAHRTHDPWLHWFRFRVAAAGRGTLRCRLCCGGRCGCHRSVFRRRTERRQHRQSRRPCRLHSTRRFSISVDFWATATATADCLSWPGNGVSHRSRNGCVRNGFATYYRPSGIFRFLSRAPHDGPTVNVPCRVPSCDTLPDSVFVGSTGTRSLRRCNRCSAAGLSLPFE
jgi:hypothetical protein